MTELLEEELVDALDLEEPDTVIGESVVFKGALQFERLLRIDGQFEGELTSSGALIVGPTAQVTANLHLQTARIEGQVTGDLHITDRLELRSGARIQGSITARTLLVEEGVQITGHVKVG